MSLLYRIINRLPVPRLTRLRWQEILLDRHYSRDIRIAKKKGDRNEVASLESAHHYESELNDQEAALIHTRQLVNQARRLRVPIPPHGEKDGFWEEASQLGSWHLTEAGNVAIREAIRKELVWRREQRAHWITVFSTSIGIIGALTGLVAVLRK